MANSEYVIEMRKITKAFGAFKANDQVDLQVRPGEIHALLGENGAGKSTLMNVLSGLLEPTSGQIYLNGKPVKIDSPNKANSLGIGMVHQHFMLIDAFTVTENIILGSEPNRGGVINIHQAEKDIQELSDRYNLDVDPTAKVADISVGMQQRAEILKTLYRGANVLIFDEPTAVLTPQEIEELIEIMKNLVKEGKSIILITHKLSEIRQAADRCTVIRRGKTIGTVEVAGASSEDLATMMVGHSVTFKIPKQPAKLGPTTLQVKDLHVNENRGIPAVKGVDFSVKSGEILGIAGIDGNGQTELIEALTGLRKIVSGEILIKNHERANAAPRKITETGVAHVPEDRQKYGLVLQLSLAENLALQTYYRAPISEHGFLDYGKMREHAKRLIKEYDIRTTNEQLRAGELSGGNQQKAIIARELDRDADLIIVAQPTRGLDVGAIEYIHRQLIAQRDAGKAVLLISFELDEIMNLSDRIIVLHDGKIAGEVRPETTTEQELGLLMAGQTQAETAKEEI
ncbi:ABC transporter ATP-binding protein [Lapidilactobacillus achengensis]|uniref:ABC transporter ATP-binding protein n=1 Tax=Lapidilactobacillus achengensis TaxID=2486000 RepID=A0ABW1UMU6_9LACO|nr:ABC transporter ATP-binding protein [Lapidilactobacillus achengensis]